MDFVLIPQITGIDPLRFRTEYPPGVQYLLRMLISRHIAAGWAGNLEVIRRA